MLTVTLDEVNRSVHFRSQLVQIELPTRAVTRVWHLRQQRTVSRCSGMGLGLAAALRWYV